MTAKKFTAWSWSRYQAYQTCPAKLKYEALDKLPVPKNAAMQRGADLHDVVADYLTGKRPRLPAELQAAKPAIDALKAFFKQAKKLVVKGMAPNAEEEWAFTAKWGQSEWRDWANTWLRIKLDVGWWETETRYRLRDWKTGKMSERSVQEYLEQLELYALAVLLRFPHCQETAPDLYFLDTAQAYPKPDALITFTRKDIPRLQKTWALRVKRLLADTKFAPKPGWQCPGCWFNHSTSLGWKEKTAKPAGPCKF